MRFQGQVVKLQGPIDPGGKIIGALLPPGSDEINVGVALSGESRRYKVFYTSGKQTVEGPSDGVFFLGLVKGQCVWLVDVTNSQTISADAFVPANNLDSSQSGETAGLSVAATT